MAGGKNVGGEGRLVKELFSNNVVYSMPLFQRGYVWKKENLDAYWEDLENLIKPETNPNETSFLGALVLQTKVSESDRTAVEPPKRYIVIDGQQRLTTFYLTLLALLVYAMKQEQKGHEQKDKNQMNTQDFSSWSRRAGSEDHKRYLFSREESNPEEVRLIPSRSDHAQFDAILSELNEGLEKLAGEREQKLPKLLSEKPKRSGNLFRAYGILQEKIESFIEADDDMAERRARYGKILQALLSKTEVVQIITTPNLSPYEIFDRLNTRGVDLGIFDWVRNYAFEKIPSDKANADKVNADKSERFNTEVWKPFESRLKDVSEITDLKLLKGKKKEKREEKRQEEQSKNFIAAYGSIAVRNFTIRKKNIRLKGHWDKEIGGKKRRYGGAEIVVESLEEHLPSYLALCAEKEPDRIDPELWRLIESMSAFSLPSLTYPFLMPVIRSSMEEGGLPASSAIQAFKIVESFLARRTLAGLDRGGLTPVFQNLWKDCEKENMTPELILRIIKERAGSGFHENDEEVKHNIHKVAVDGKDGLRYILMQYEAGFRENRPALEPPLHECHIDHIMPKAESKPKGTKVSSEEAERARLCGTLGNLTLLDPGINLRKSSKGLKKEIKKDPQSVRGLLEQSHLLSVEALLAGFDKGKEDSWGANSIERRGEELADWVIERWPLAPEKFYPQNTQAKRAKPKSRR